MYASCGGYEELAIGCVGYEEMFFMGMELDDPTITLITPEAGTQDLDGVIRFSYIPNDANTISNCSLIANGATYTTTTIVSNGTENIIEVVSVEENHPLYSDNLQWRIDCSDYLGNEGSSETRALDTKSDEVAGSGGGGGGGGSGAVTKNPKSVDLFYTSKWMRESEVEVVMKIYNKNNVLYSPPILEFDLSSASGIEIVGSKTNEELEIVTTLRVLDYAELGIQTINVTIEDERKIEKALEIEVVKKGVLQSAIGEAKDFDQDKNIVKYFLWALGFFVLMAMVIITIRIFSKKKRKSSD